MCRLTAGLMERMCRHCTDAAHWSHFGQTYLSHYDICGCSNVRNKAKDGRSKKMKNNTQNYDNVLGIHGDVNLLWQAFVFLKSIVSTNAVNKEFWVVKITLKSTQLCEWAFVWACVTAAGRLRTLDKSCKAEVVWIFKRVECSRITYGSWCTEVFTCPRRVL